MFLDVAKLMLEQMEQHKRTPSELRSFYIEARLEKSIQSYYDKLKKSQYYLQYNTQAKPTRLTKELNKTYVQDNS